MLKANWRNIVSNIDYAEHLEECLEKAIKGKSKLPKEVQVNAGDFRTPSSSNIRRLQNNICNFEGVKYLEIGTYMGTSIISSSFGNEGYFVTMDNFSQFQKAKGRTTTSKQQFLINREAYKKHAKFNFFECDCWQFDKSQLEHKINVYFYDGRHDYEDTFKAFTYFDDILEDEFIFMIDDWNVGYVQKATKAVFKEKNYEITYSKEFLKKPRSEWWNGLYYGVIKKPQG